MAALSKLLRPDNFQSHNSLKFISANVPGLYSDFVSQESFLESSFPDTIQREIAWVN